MTYDYVIAGAGIIGLAVAQELKSREPKARVLILDKERALGRHASGRNSGVLHSGIYYSEGSLKARVCVEGAAIMARYCQERGLPYRRSGKVIVGVREGDTEQIDILYRRALANGAKVEIIDEGRLRELEPEARDDFGKALWAPDTSVIDPMAVVDCLAGELTEAGVELGLGRAVVGVDTGKRRITTSAGDVKYGHFINAAGLHADKLARLCGLRKKYEIIPFKGLYYQLTEDAPLDIRGLIYPVPDPNLPFLGVHFTKAVDGTVYVGPSAVPALGRESYRGLQDVRLGESGRILRRLSAQYLRNRGGFRRFAHLESIRFLKPNFAAAARALVPRIESRQLLRSAKVGIRAQLLDVEKAELIMDFVIERQASITHVLNAVSPGFTSSFSFAKLVVDEVGGINGS